MKKSAKERNVNCCSSCRVLCGCIYKVARVFFSGFAVVISLSSPLNSHLSGSVLSVLFTIFFLSFFSIVSSLVSLRCLLIIFLFLLSVSLPHFFSSLLVFVSPRCSCFVLSFFIYRFCCYCS